MNYEMQLLPNRLGAEITGYDFDQIPEEGTIRWLRKALIEHHILIFRGRTLEPAKQITFTALFGGVVQTCSPRTRFFKDFPEIFRVSNREGQGHLNIGPYWHSDGAYLKDPTAVSIHHIIVPTTDGNTLYTDLADAYDRLLDRERLWVSQMKTRGQTGVVHPLVRQHPVTSRVGLYVNMDVGAVIIDGTGQESREMRDFLYEHLSREGTFYRHKWREGDMVVVDNFAVAHQATCADPAELRVLHRTSIHGPSVWWTR